MREVEAEKPTFALIVSIMTIDAITAAPERDWTAWWKMAINGKAGFSARTASMSPRRSNTASTMTKPRDPLIAIPIMIDLGTASCAL